MLDLDGTENKTNLGANAILGRKGGENHGNIWGKGKACFIFGRSHAMMKDWGGFTTNSLSDLIFETVKTAFFEPRDFKSTNIFH